MTTFRQIVSLTQLSVRRLACTRLMFWMVLLAAMPVLMLLLIGISIHVQAMGTGDTVKMHQLLERNLRTFYLHIIVFVVSIISGFAIIRQDLDDRTLHYIVLAPVKRWSVIVAKFAAFWFVTTLLLLASYWGSYLIAVLMIAGPGMAVRDLFGEAAWFGVLVRESIVIILAMTALGAIGMAAGSVFKSLIFAPFLWIWESLLSYMPPAIKKLTLSHYFYSMLPVQVTEKRSFLEMLGQPATVGQCLMVLACVTAISVAVALLAFWWRECAYVEEQA